MIINSLLDTDLYKLTMMQAVFHQFPGVDVEYTFKCRNDVSWNEHTLFRIREEIDNLCSLRFKDDELDYLNNITFFKRNFIDFLKLFQLNREHIYIWLENEELKIEIKGNWLLTILFEVPVLAIVNEVFFEDSYPTGGSKRLSHKIQVAAYREGFRFSDFGTRRRYSKDWHRTVLNTIVESIPNYFSGTSNVMFAKELGIKPIGTMAHEWLQAGQAVGVRLIDSQKYMLQKWVDEYRGDLGIALTDVVGVDAFLKDFDEYFAKLYDGVRHDSGDPIEWGKKIIEHYDNLGIDPKTKTLVFSDGLNFEKALKIYETFMDKAKVAFGIGTNLTNDFDDIDPLQIVIKMTNCNWQPVAKISDSPGKGMCKDGKYLEYLKEVFEI